MPIYTGSKSPPGGLHPTNATATTFNRLEPLLTVDQLKSRHLKGIPLTLKIKDPDTGKPYRIMDEELKDYIQSAVDEAEIETGLTLMPTKFKNKLPYQRQDFESLGYLQLPHRPIASIDSLTVRLSDESDVFTFPTTWIETANLIWGQINIQPLAFSGLDGANQVIGQDSATGTSVFFNNLWNRPWVAALFGVEYTTGFKDGLMPRVVNDLIGIIATMRVLSMIAAAYSQSTSTSLGIDGMSQSVGTPGPERFRVRIDELKEQRKLLNKKLKKIFGTSFVTGTV